MQNYNDKLLERFLSTQWSESERMQSLNVANDELPYLPLDIKIPDQDLKIIVETINSFNSDNFFYYCTTKHSFPTNMEKLVFFGVEDYKKFFQWSADAQSHEDFELNFNKHHAEWHIKIPELINFCESLPVKQLYSVESRNAKPDGKEYVHVDKEKMFSGMHNRLYIPLYWPSEAEFSFSGIGKMWIDPGRLYVFNGNRTPHGSHNKSNQRRLSLIIHANTLTEDYNDLIKDSVKKYKKYM